MRIEVIPRWTFKEGLGVGLSITWPSRCAVIEGDQPGTCLVAGFGLGLLVARVYFDFVWGFKPFNS